VFGKFIMMERQERKKIQEELNRSLEDNQENTINGRARGSVLLSDNACN
jgi:hypothetical protein